MRDPDSLASNMTFLTPHAGDAHLGFKPVTPAAHSRLSPGIRLPPPSSITLPPRAGDPHHGFEPVTPAAHLQHGHRPVARHGAAQPLVTQRPRQPPPAVSEARPAHGGVGSFTRGRGSVPRVTERGSASESCEGDARLVFWAAAGCWWGGQALGSDGELVRDQSGAGQDST
jgi:hypothetical protein